MCAALPGKPPAAGASPVRCENATRAVENPRSGGQLSACSLQKMTCSALRIRKTAPNRPAERPPEAEVSYLHEGAADDRILTNHRRQNRLPESGGRRRSWSWQSALPWRFTGVKPPPARRRLTPKGTECARTGPFPIDIRRLRLIERKQIRGMHRLGRPACILRHLSHKRYFEGRSSVNHLAWREAGPAVARRAAVAH